MYAFRKFKKAKYSVVQQFQNIYRNEKFYKLSKQNSDIDTILLKTVEQSLIKQNKFRLSLEYSGMRAMINNTLSLISLN